MKCNNCGFEFDEGALCPTCGAEYDEEQFGQAEIIPEPLIAESDEPQSNENTAEQPQNPSGSSLPGKKFFIILTAVLCAVIILSSAVVSVFLFLFFGRIEKSVTDTVSTAVSDSYANGYEDAIEQIYVPDDYYDSYDNREYIDSGETFQKGETYEFDYGSLTLTDCTTTKDTLSADKDVCEMTFTFALDNTTDYSQNFTEFSLWAYPVVDYEEIFFDSLYVTIESTEDGGVSAISSIFSDNNTVTGDFDVTAHSQAVITFTVTGPKIDAATLNLGLTSDKYYLIAQFAADF